MARRSRLPSDPAFLLEYMQDLPVESDSDGEFDGYLEADDGANGDTHDEAATTPLRRSHSQHKGHIIVTDNFYSSPALFRDLLSRGFGACGTARKDRRGIQPSVRTANLQRGEVVSSRDDGILSLKWKDKRDVMMLSTYHDTSMISKSRRSRRAAGGVEAIYKPKIVEDYNLNMGGVDKRKFTQNGSVHAYLIPHFQVTNSCSTTGSLTVR